MTSTPPPVATPCIYDLTITIYSIAKELMVVEISFRFQNDFIFIAKTWFYFEFHSLRIFKWKMQKIGKLNCCMMRLWAVVGNEIKFLADRFVFICCTFALFISNPLRIKNCQIVKIGKIRTECWKSFLFFLLFSVCVYSYRLKNLN